MGLGKLGLFLLVALLSACHKIVRVPSVQNDGKRITRGNLLSLPGLVEPAAPAPGVTDLLDFTKPVVSPPPDLFTCEVKPTATWEEPARGWRFHYEVSASLAFDNINISIALNSRLSLLSIGRTTFAADDPELIRGSGTYQVDVELTNGVQRAFCTATVANLVEPPPPLPPLTCEVKPTVAWEENYTEDSRGWRFTYDVTGSRAFDSVKIKLDDAQRIYERDLETDHWAKKDPGLVRGTATYVVQAEVTQGDQTVVCSKSVGKLVEPEPIVPSCKLALSSRWSYEPQRGHWLDFYVTSTVPMQKVNFFAFHGDNIFSSDWIIPNHELASLHHAQQAVLSQGDNQWHVKVFVTPTRGPTLECNADITMVDKPAPSCTIAAVAKWHEQGRDGERKSGWTFDYEVRMGEGFEYLMRQVKINREHDGVRDPMRTHELLPPAASMSGSFDTPVVSGVANDWKIQAAAYFEYLIEPVICETTLELEDPPLPWLACEMKILNEDRQTIFWGDTLRFRASLDGLYAERAEYGYHVETQAAPNFSGEVRERPVNTFDADTGPLPPGEAMGANGFLRDYALTVWAKYYFDRRPEPIYCVMGVNIKNPEAAYSCTVDTFQMRGTPNSPAIIESKDVSWGIPPGSPYKTFGIRTEVKSEHSRATLSPTKISIVRRDLTTCPGHTRIVSATQLNPPQPFVSLDWEANIYPDGLPPGCLYDEREFLREYYYAFDVKYYHNEKLLASCPHYMEIDNPTPYKVYDLQILVPKEQVELHADGFAARLRQSEEFRQHVVNRLNPRVGLSLPSEGVPGANLGSGEYSDLAVYLAQLVANYGDVIDEVWKGEFGYRVSIHFARDPLISRLAQEIFLVACESANNRSILVERIFPTAYARGYAIAMAMRPILCSWFPGRCSSRVYEAVMGVLPPAVENACLYGKGLLPAAALDPQAVEVYNGILANMTAGAKEAVNQKVAKFQGKISAMAAMFDYRHRPSIFAVDDAQIKAKYSGTQIEAKWWDRDNPSELLFRGECSSVPIEDLPDCLSALAMQFESQTLR